MQASERGVIHGLDTNLKITLSCWNVIRICRLLEELYLVLTKDTANVVDVVSLGELLIDSIECGFVACNTSCNRKKPLLIHLPGP